MADPAGLVSLGITTTHLIWQYYGAYKDYDQDVTRVCDLLRHLQQTLKVVQPYVSHESSRPEVREHVAQSAETLLQYTIQLEKKLQKISSSRLPQDSLKKKAIHKYSQKLTYPFRQSTLAKLCELASAFQERLSDSLSILGYEEAYNSTHIIKQLASDAASKRQQDVLEWLPGSDFSAQRQDISAKTTPGTGDWFIQSLAFQEWLTGQLKPLCCYGGPGAGKTYLASNIIDYLQQARHLDPKSAICYLFCNYKMQQTNLIDMLLASLIEQLARQMPIFPQLLLDIWSNCQKLAKRPSTSEYLRSIKSMLSTFQSSYLIVDALDECASEPKTRNTFIDHLLDLSATTELRILVTSRNIPEILNRFWDDNQVEISASLGDLTLFLSSQMSRLEQTVQSNENFCQEVIECIAKCSDGIFLLAKLHVDSLIQEAVTPSRARKLLKALPRGRQGLDIRYKEAVDRIIHQGSAGRRELAKNALLWCTLSRRRLTTIELLHALAIDDEIVDGEDDLDRENIPSLDLVLSSCAGLLMRNEKTNVVEFAHFTAQTYLEPFLEAWYHSGHALLLKRCLKYLSYTSLILAMSSGDTVLRKTFALRKYAALSMSHHASFCNYLEYGREIKLYLEDPERRRCILRILMLHDESPVFAEKPPVETVTALHLSAYYGLRETVKSFVAGNANIDARDGSKDEVTPLGWAAANGHTETVRDLLDHGANVSDTHSGVLTWAVLSENPATVKAVVDHASYRFVTKRHYRRALEISIARVSKEVFDMLLPKFSSKMVMKSRPFNEVNDIVDPRIARYVVTELLTRGYEPDNWTDNHFRHSPLAKAARRGKDEIFSLFLNHVHTSLTQNWLAHDVLVAAVQRGNLQRVQLVLDHGVDVNIIWCQQRGTALDTAVLIGHLTMVEYLLDRGASLSSEGYAHVMILLRSSHYEVNNEHVRKVMEAIANEKSDYQNAFGAKYGLADCDIYPSYQEVSSDAEDSSSENKTDSDDETNPKASNSHKVGRLDVRATESDQALSVYTEQPSKDSNQSSKTGSKGFNQESRKDYSPSDGESSNTRNAVEQDRDKYSRMGTPLQVATLLGNIRIAAKLLERSADPDASGGTLGNSLQLACKMENLEMIELLLGHNADANVPEGIFGKALPMIRKQAAGKKAEKRGYTMMEKMERIEEMLLQHGALE